MRRREALVAQIAMERAEIAHHGASIRRIAHIVDKVFDGIQYVKRHPGALLLPVVITAMARPRRLLAMAVSGLGVWRLVQRWRQRIR